MDIRDITPLQYSLRAHEALAIASVQAQPKQRLAAQVALAELVQIIFFATLATVYTLAFTGVIPPLAAGIVALVLLPVGTIAAYNTFIHYKHVSRTFMTIAAVCTLTICALIACYGSVGDSAITLCAGGVLVHSLRNLSEYIDTRKILATKPDYIKTVLSDTPANP